MKLSVVTLGISSLAYFFYQTSLCIKEYCWVQILHVTGYVCDVPSCLLDFSLDYQPQFANGAPAQTGLEAAAEIEKGLMLD